MAKVAKKKVQVKLDQNCQKAQQQAHIYDIERLVIGNSQIGSFKDNLSDSIPVSSRDLPDPSFLTTINQTSATIQSITSICIILSQQQAKKKAIISHKASSIY